MRIVCGPAESSSLTSCAHASACWQQHSSQNPLVIELTPTMYRTEACRLQTTREKGPSRSLSLEYFSRLALVAQDPQNILHSILSGVRLFWEHSGFPSRIASTNLVVHHLPNSEIQHTFEISLARSTSRRARLSEPLLRLSLVPLAISVHKCKQKHGGAHKHHLHGGGLSVGPGFPCNGRCVCCLRLLMFKSYSC